MTMRVTERENWKKVRRKVEEGKETQGESRELLKTGKRRRN